MPRIFYQAGDKIGFATLDGKAASSIEDGKPEPGVWIALCSGPSHVGTKEFRLITRDIYYRRPKAFGCSDCRDAVLAWMRARGIHTYGDDNAPMRHTRPPAPVQGLVVGRLLLDEWIPKSGWVCACLCGCGEYETVRTTQLVPISGLRPCPVTGRVRPATGCRVTYRDGEETVVAYEDSASTQA